MNPKARLMYLLKHFYMENYDIIDFTNEFHRIYTFEVDYSELSENERQLLSELYSIVGRFTEFEEDLKMYPNAYFSKDDVKEKATEVYLSLKE